MLSIWEMADTVSPTEVFIDSDACDRDFDISETELAELKIFPTSIRMFWENVSNPLDREFASAMKYSSKLAVKSPVENLLQCSTMVVKVLLMRRAKKTVEAMARPSWATMIIMMSFTVSFTESVKSVSLPIPTKNQGVPSTGEMARYWSSRINDCVLPFCNATCC